MTDHLTMSSIAQRYGVEYRDKLEKYLMSDPDMAGLLWVEYCGAWSRGTEPDCLGLLWSWIRFKEKGYDPRLCGVRKVGSRDIGSFAEWHGLEVSDTSSDDSDYVTWLMVGMPDSWARVLRLVGEGYSCSEIGVMDGVSRQAVHLKYVKGLEHCRRRSGIV